MAVDLESRVVGGTGPLDADIAEIVAAIAPLMEGAVADYIPELGKADPSWFGVSVATVDGAVYTAGDAGQPFTIQSISKPFVYGLALADRGRDEVLRRVGVEPTGDAFNSIEIDVATSRPFNPMVNAGAIVTAGLVDGPTPAARADRVVEFMSRFAGRDLVIDEDVYRSEHQTGDRNRAIAYFMRGHGMLDEVDSVLDLYFRQCSVLVTCRDLAVMAATLANGGRNPVTGERALDGVAVESVLSVMATCGMYDYAGEWLYTVGLPAKSGVTGGVIAVLPGQLGIGVFSPRLDARGNSVRGIAVCQELSRRFHLHQYRPGLVSTNAVRRAYHGDVARARRTRTEAEAATLDREGHRVCVYELRGELAFGPVERLVRTVTDDLPALSHVVLDFRRVTAIDEVSCGLLRRLADDAERAGVRLIGAHLPQDRLEIETATDLDDALQRCEEEILDAALDDRHQSMALADHPLFAGCTPDQIACIEAVSPRRLLSEGDVLCREGEPADHMYLVCSGALRAEVAHDGGGPPTPLVTLGPGTAVGEIALLDGGRRSATVVAVAPTEIRSLPFDALEGLAARHPSLLETLYRNLGRLLASRLRRVTGQVRALER